MMNGCNVWVAILAATCAGLLAGFVTGIFHTFMGIQAILAGILTQLALWSVNLKIMGKANQAINVDKYDLIVSLRYIKGVPLYQNTIFVVAVIIAVLIAVLYWFFGTELGCGIRATGCNAAMARAQGINTNRNKVLGLMISNGLVALSGALLAQYQGFADTQRSTVLHRHRPGRRHHRRSAAQPHLPQLCAQARLGGGGQHRLLPCLSGRDLVQGGHRPAQGVQRRRGRHLPGRAVLEGQILHPCRRAERGQRPCLN